MGSRVCAVVFGTARADSGMPGDLALRFCCSGCIGAAGKLGEPVTQHTHIHTNLKKDTYFSAQHANHANIISVILALAFSSPQTAGLDCIFIVCVILGAFFPAVFSRSDHI